MSRYLFRAIDAHGVQVIPLRSSDVRPIDYLSGAIDPVGQLRAIARRQATATQPELVVVEHSS